MNLGDVTSKKETLKQLDEVVLNLETKEKIEELEKKSQKLTKLLDDFASKVPVFVQKLETINKGLKTKEFNDFLNNIEKTVESNSLKINELVSFNKNTIATQEKNIKSIIENAENSLKFKGNFYKNLNRCLLLMVVLLLVVNLGIIYLSNKRVGDLERRMEIVSLQNETIYKVLLEEEKFWINKEDQKLYLKELEKIENAKK